MIPANQEAERALVAALVEQPDYCRATVMGLEPDALTHPLARAVVEAFVTTGETDRVALATHAATHLGDAVPKVLGYLRTCEDGAHDYRNIATYAELVREAARRRQAVVALNTALNALVAGEPTSKVIPQTLTQLKQHLGERRAPTLAELVEAHYAQVQAYHENPLPEGQVRGLSTGLLALNKLIGGLEPSLVLVAARPSVGKTALGTKIALEAARQFRGSEQVVVYFTDEMSGGQLLTRLACGEAQVNREALRGGRLGHAELARYFTVLGELRELPLEIVYAYQLGEILARGYQEPVPGLVVVDYLNKLTGGQGENRNQQFGAIASSLFDLAADVQIPVLLLAQLNRDIKYRGKGALPRLDDLRDSGELEDVADVVLMLHREDDAERDEYDPRRLLIIKRKDRLGGGQHNMTAVRLGVYGEVQDITGQVPPMDGSGV